MSLQDVDMQAARHVGLDDRAADTARRVVTLPSQASIYPVWDATVRLCHWTLVLSFLFLAVTGMLILYSGDLKIAGEAKVNLKLVHVWGGYVCAAALLVRIIHGFRGGHASRWTTILRISRRDIAELVTYLAARQQDRKLYAGHNPAGRLMVVALIALLVVQVATGLLIGSTDTYAWPFGDMIRAWVAAPGVDPQSLVAGSKAGVSEANWAEMRAFRYPFYITHEYVFYILSILVVVHVGAVAWMETVHRIPIVSAMMSGTKILPGPAADMPSRTAAPDAKDPQR